MHALNFYYLRLDMSDSINPYCLNCMGVETYMLYEEEDDDDTSIVSETKSESDNAEESVVSFDLTNDLQLI